MRKRTEAPEAAERGRGSIRPKGKNKERERGRALTPLLCRMKTCLCVRESVCISGELFGSVV